jgi:hypothetical protein
MSGSLRPAKGPRFAGRWGAIIIASTLVVFNFSLGIGPTDVATASHGSWIKHTYTVTDPSPCCYKGWSTVRAENTFNKGAVIFQLWYSGGDIIVHREETCSGGGCGPKMATNEYNWSQGSPQKFVRYFGCAKAGTHELSGDTSPLACVSLGLAAHFHKSGDFT